MVTQNPKQKYFIDFIYTSVLKPESMSFWLSYIFLDLIVDGIYLFFPFKMIIRYAARVRKFVVCFVLSVDVVLICPYFGQFISQHRRISLKKKEFH